MSLTQPLAFNLRESRSIPPCCVDDESEFLNDQKSERCSFIYYFTQKRIRKEIHLHYACDDRLSQANPWFPKGSRTAAFILCSGENMYMALLVFFLLYVCIVNKSPLYLFPFLMVLFF